MEKISWKLRDSTHLIYQKDEKIQTKQYIIKPERFIIIKISCKYRDSVEKKYQVKREIHHTQNIKETKDSCHTIYQI